MSYLETYSKWIIKYRWWIVVSTTIVVIIIGSGLQFLTFSNDLRVFFSEENPQLQALEFIENTYNRIDNVLFVIAPKDKNVFTRKTLKAVEELTEASWKIPHSNRVDSITNFQHTRAEEDDLLVDYLVQHAETLSDTKIAQIRDIALHEPLLVNRLISTSGHVTGINVTILLPDKSKNDVPLVATFVREMSKEFMEKYPHIEVYLAGAIMFDNAFGEATADDISILVPIMFASILIVIGLALRSIVCIFATLFVTLFSTITAMGLAGWIGVSLDPASANAPTIILVLAVADSVHLLSIISKQMRLGTRREAAIIESLRINLRPVFLTSATTAIGFLTMNFSDAPPFRTLGTIVAMGVIAAFVYSVTFLPAFMAVIPIRVRERSKSSADASWSCDRLASYVISHQNKLLLGTLIIGGFLMSGIIVIDLNDDWVGYFGKRYEIRRASDFVNENLSGLYAIEYSLDSGERGGINKPEFLGKVEEFANWYRDQPKVIHVNTITDIVKRLNKNMHGDDENYYRIPQQRNLAAQYLLLYEISIPFGLDLNNQVNVDKSATRMIVGFQKLTTRELLIMEEKSRQWLSEYAPDMHTYGSGLAPIWAHISYRNIKSMLSASILALISISVILIIALRSFKFGVLSLIPNLSPAFMAFGLWGLVKGQVGLALSVVVAMTLGIVVDDTIHFITKYIRARQVLNINPSGAVRYAFNTVGTALWVTTVALVAGFLVLTFSGYRMNAEMGLLTAITILFALLLDFLFLPTLLMKFERKAEKLSNVQQKKSH
jgi:predicted RND superfamily exporter protein